MLAFVFIAALGTDYDIFLMHRIREETARHGAREGARRGLTLVGGVIVSAGVVLAATFGALAVLPLVGRVQMAFWCRSACCWTPWSCGRCWCPP